MVIYGALGLPENDRSLVNSIGEQVVYSAAEAFIAQHNADLERAYSVFVEGTTEGNKDYYKLPGGGRLPRLGMRSRGPAIKAGGRWDVAFPLENFGGAFEYADIDFAYMTVQQMANELATIRTMDVSAVRHEILLRLFYNVDREFVDELPMNPGTLTIKPLANQDGTLYPPAIGSGSDNFAEQDHYKVSGYAASAIDNDNNPFPVLREELEHHFGTPSGYGNVCVFIHTDQVAKVEDLPDFIEVTDIGVNPGDDTATVGNAPMGPGRLIGRCNGCWVYEWRWIPSGYLLAIDYDQPSPIKIRIHPRDIPKPSVLTMVAQDNRYPIQTRHYEHWFGVGVGNRLNGVCMELTTDVSYDPPAVFNGY